MPSGVFCAKMGKITEHPEEVPLKIRKQLLRLCCLTVAVLLLPATVALALEKPSQAGERKLEGGQRDFRWPVPGNYNLSSCYLDKRNHYSLDIAAPTGTKIVASYDGVVVSTFTGCDHNWGKSSNCCSSLGNQVLLKHIYTLKNGSKVTLYSRYGHMTDVTVSPGQSVSAGEKIGTVGSTGRSSGPHLDYDILYGGYSSKTYSLDPYINDLLELPEELHTTFGKCCQEYVAYVKQYYPRCTHASYTAQGKCTSCGYEFNWKSTRDADAMGYYTVSAPTKAQSVPYQQSGGTALESGKKVSVEATVVNGLNQSWYEVSLETGTSYVPASALTFHSYYDSQIKGSLSTLENGQVLPQASHRLNGLVTSRYPLRKLYGYLDGENYATWTGKGGTRELYLRGTALNKDLNFSALAPGEHTLVIYAEDSTGREKTEIIRCTFVTEKTPSVFTVTYLTEPEKTERTVTEGQELGELLNPGEKEGVQFLGWFPENEGGEAVSAQTVPTADMTLYPRWETLTFTVTLDGEPQTLPYGTVLSLPEKEKTGHTFAGWATSDGVAVADGMIVTDDLELVSQFAPCIYVLTLDGAEEITVTFGSAYGPLPVPEKEGFTFLGWQMDGETVTETDIVQTASDHALTALWEEIPKEEPEEQAETGGTWWPVAVIAVVTVGAGAAGAFFLRSRKQQGRFVK